MQDGNRTIEAMRVACVMAPIAWVACAKSSDQLQPSSGSGASGGGGTPAVGLGGGATWARGGANTGANRNADQVEYGGSAVDGGGSSAFTTQGGRGGAQLAGGFVGTTPGGGFPEFGGRGVGGSTAGGGGASDSGAAPAHAGGGAGSSHALVPPTSACAKLAVENNKAVTASVGSTVDTDVVTWRDANCLQRAAAMARDTRGYVRQFTYQYDGKTRVASGTNANNSWNGFGYVVNHELPNGGSTGAGPTGYKALFVGDHHAIYQYQSNAGGNVRVTRHWFFATGRDHPVFAVTFDTSARSAGIGADTRTPYGDIAWDGDENASTTVVDGVGWGDRYQFVTTKAPLTLNSTWDYSRPNLVPYCMEWRVNPDAEMGLVQTQTYQQHDAGGYWLYSNWGKTSSNQTKDKDQIALMPIDWNWPYQLNQYELCYPNDSSCVNSTTSSHRVAWGTNYGAVGGKESDGTYPAFGDDKQLLGYPYQSYSVFVVLGKHSANAVLGQVREIEAAQQVSIAATAGSVLKQGPAGVGRTDNVKLDPPGYDARYSTWNLQADSNRVAFTVTVGGAAVTDPIVVVHGFTGATVPAVTIDGVSAVAEVDFLASLDTSGQLLWITFRPGWSGTHQITVG